MAHTLHSLKRTLDQQRDPANARPFLARGSSVVRCPACLVAAFACICQWKITLTSETRFILLMHRKEVYKTTNTGHLIEDLLPHSTQTFLWERTTPNASLLQAINNPDRQTAILFPSHSIDNIDNEPAANMPSTQKPLTVILLDGTWKQASRMAKSHWLQHIPRMDIQPQYSSQTYIRQAAQENQLSTAQAAACLLEQQGEGEVGNALQHYFSVFNQHCHSTRSNVKPEITDSHLYLEKISREK